MDINTAKQQVIDAGKQLVAKGLISRTWGNVSYRLDDKSFVITPSGKPYETLTPEQIVQVSIETLEHEGDVKPSSEKGVHAEVYKARPEINFVIHTHQMNASIMSSLGSDIRYVPEAAAEVIGTGVPLAAYGLPGTKTLKLGVAAALKNPGIRALLMAHHGALCFGEDSEKAFEAALVLEDVCALQIYTQVKKIYGADIDSIQQFAAVTAQNETDCKKVQAGSNCSSRREGESFVLSFADSGKSSVTVNLATGKASGGTAPAEAELHRAIYQKRKEINYIIHSRSVETVAASCFCKSIKPQVDDFAQIVGADVRCVAFDEANAEKSAARCIKAMKGRHGLLLKGDGALCCGPDESDAAAVEMIMEKNCLTFLATVLFNVYQPITPLHSHLMRLVYLKKYSKQAK